MAQNQVKTGKQQGNITASNKRRVRQKYSIPSTILPLKEVTNT